MRIGLISDTHGLLRSQALAWLAGCDHILHAGDIGNPSIMDALSTIASVTAVRGNNDTEEWALALPERVTIRMADVAIHLLHDANQLDIDPHANGIAIVISGHSHKPSIKSRGTVLFVNPGSAGPRRFRLPVTVGELIVRDDGTIEPLIHELAI